MAIVKRVPLTRSSEKIYHDNGTIKVKCWSPNNPHFYSDSTGGLHDIELSYEEDKTLAIDDCKIKNKNIMSVGVRVSDNTNKYIGIRPDNKQDGSQQLEFSLIDISLDGQSKSKIDLKDHNKVDDLTNDLGDLLIRGNRQGIRQLVKSTSAKEDFAIKFNLHLTGLSVANDTKIYSNEVIREASPISTDIQHAGTLDSSSLVEAWVNDIEQVADSTATNYIRSSYITYDHIIVGGDIDTFSIPSDWTKSSDARNLGFPEALYCKSSYMKDVFEVYIHNPNMSIDKIRELYANFLTELTGKSADLSLKNQSLIVLDGTAAVGMWAICNDGKSLTIQIKLAHHEEVNYLWNNDTQHITGYIDSSPSEVLQAWQDNFVSDYEAYMNSKESTELVLDGEYYEPNENGDFRIVDGEGNTVYRIAKPKLLDNKFDIISDKTIHTLKDNGDGTYEYIKYPDAECMLSDDIKDSKYIDADTYYGDTADGYILGSAAGSASFAIERALTSGQTPVTNAASFNQGLTAWAYKAWQIGRTFLMFDTSAITSTVTACDLNVYGLTRADGYSACGVSCQQGTQGTSLVAGDFDAFSGTYFDYIASGSWSESGYNTFEFNSTGVSAVSTTGTTQICLREYTHDYLNSANADGTYFAEGMYYADNTGTTKDPYLEVTTGIPDYILDSTGVLVISDATAELSLGTDEALSGDATAHTSISTVLTLGITEVLSGTTSAQTSASATGMDSGITEVLKGTAGVRSHDNGLIGRWDCNGLLWDVALVDWSGKGNYGLVTDTTAVVGYSNDAIEFDGPGSGSRVDIQENSKTDYDFTTEDFSVSFWMKTSDYTTNQRLINKGQALGNGWEIRLNNDEILVHSNQGSSRTTISAAYTYTDWRHIVVTKSGNIWTLYINNSEVDSDTLEVPLSSSDHVLVFGAYYNGSTDYNYTGLLDEIRIYNRALSISDIEGLNNYPEEDNYTKLSRGPQIPTYGLVGQWNFNENSGTHVQDISGNDNHGTAYNDPTWTPGQSGSAISLDGVDQYINCGITPEISGMSAVTLAGWIKLKNVTSTWQWLFGKSVFWGNGQGFGFYTNLTTLGFQCYGDVNALVSLGNWTSYLDEWHHICGTYDGSTVRVYLDGTEVGTPGSTSGTVGRSTTSFDMGKTAYPPECDLDEIYVYDRALSASEINVLYQAVNDTHVESLNHTEHFGVDSDTTLLLHTPSNNSGTVDTSKYWMHYGAAPNLTYITPSNFGNSYLDFQGSGANTLYSEADPDYADITTTNWHCEFWIKHNTIAARQDYVWSNTGTTNYWFIIEDFVTNGLWFRVRTGNVNRIEIQVADTEDTNWHHILACKVGTDWGLYRDGVQVGYDSWDGTISTTGNMVIGRYLSSWSYMLDGGMDEFRISTDNPYGLTPVSGLTDTFNVPSTPHYTGDFLLHFDGGDFSGNDHEVAAWGNPRIVSDVEKFGGSWYFDGGGDYLRIPANDDFEFGTGDFTIDMWMYPDNIANRVLIDTRNSGVWTAGLAIILVGSNLCAYVNGLTATLTGATTIPASSKWYHVAFVRNGTSMKLYLDGKEDASETAVDVLDSSNDVTIGAFSHAQWLFLGNLAEIRISKGIARWTDEFTPPSRAYAGPNEFIITSESGATLSKGPSFTATVDVQTADSTSAIILGVSELLASGTPIISDCTADLTIGVVEVLNHSELFGVDSSTVLLLRPPIDNGSADPNVNWTHTSLVKYDSSVKMFGNSSVRFSGASNSFLQAAAEPAYQDINSTNWHCEFWVKHNILTGRQDYIMNNSGTNNYYVISHDATEPGLWFRVRTSGNTRFDIYGALIEDTNWHHVLACKVGTDWGLYLDGYQVGYASWDGVLTGSDGNMAIGRTGSSGANWYNGWMDELRITTDNPYSLAPVVGLTDFFNVPMTQHNEGDLLLHFEGGDFSDSSHEIAIYGNPESSGAITNLGSYWLFDGGNDYLEIPASDDFEFGSGDYTIDLWIWPNNVVSRCLIDGRNAAITTGWVVELSASKVSFKIGNVEILLGSTIITTGEWHHIAVVRNGSTIKLYVDGLEDDSDTAVDIVAADYHLRIGSAQNGSWDYDGSMDEIHISKGVARWTDEFIPPTRRYTSSSDFVARGEVGGTLFNPPILRGSSTVVCDATAALIIGVSELLATSIVSASDATSELLMGITESMSHTTAEGVDSDTKLLLHFDANSGTATDDITHTAPLSYDTTTKKFGTSSLDLTGGAGHISISDPSFLDITETNWTFEVWIKELTHTNYPMYLTQYVNTSNYLYIYNGASAGLGTAVQIMDSGVSRISMTPGSNYGISDTDWHHVMVCKIGSDWGIYMDGVQCAHASWGGTFSKTATGYFGCLQASTYPLNGYMDEIRIGHDNPYNAAPVSGLTDTITLRTTPYQDTPALLLHCDEADTSGNDHEVYYFGNSDHSYTQSKFRSANYFDGTGDYIQIPTSSDFEMGSSNFTVDMWIYPTNVTNRTLIDERNSAFTAGWGITLDDGYLTAYINDTNATLTGDTLLTADDWYHVALVKNGSELVFYLNGVSDGTATVDNVINSSTPLRIGLSNEPDWYFIGYIDEVRVSKGIARWTEDFTPSSIAYGSKLFLSAVDGELTHGGDEILTADLTIQSNVSGNLLTYGEETLEGTVSVDSSCICSISFGVTESISTTAGSYSTTAGLLTLGITELVASTSASTSDTTSSLIFGINEDLTGSSDSVVDGTAIMSFGVPKILAGSSTNQSNVVALLSMGLAEILASTVVSSTDTTSSLVIGAIEILTASADSIASAEASTLQFGVPEALVSTSNTESNLSGNLYVGLTETLVGSLSCESNTYATLDTGGDETLVSTCNLESSVGVTELTEGLIESLSTSMSIESSTSNAILGVGNSETMSSTCSVVSTVGPSLFGLTQILTTTGNVTSDVIGGVLVFGDTEILTATSSTVSQSQNIVLDVEMTINSSQQNTVEDITYKDY